jgi:hypothetical protein
MARGRARCYSTCMSSPRKLPGTLVILRPASPSGRIIEVGVLAGGAALAAALVAMTAPRAWWPAALAALALGVSAVGWRIRRANARTARELDRLRAGTGLEVSCERAAYGLLDYPAARGRCGAAGLEATTTGAPGQTAGSTVLSFTWADGRSWPLDGVGALFEMRGLKTRSMGGAALQVNALLGDPRLVDALIELSQRR